MVLTIVVLALERDDLRASDRRKCAGNYYSGEKLLKEAKTGDGDHD